MGQAWGKGTWNLLTVERESVDGMRLILKPGDRVQTKSGRKGTIQESIGDMPYHYFVRFDHDDSIPWWIARDSVTAIGETK